MVVVDASVYVAAHRAGDRHHHRCLAWLERSLKRRVRLTAPLLLAVEATSAVHRLSGDRREAELITNRLLGGRAIELFPLDVKRARLAAAIASRARLRGADAVYVALAQELGAPLITVDRQQLERGSAVATVARPDL